MSSGQKRSRRAPTISRAMNSPARSATNRARLAAARSPGLRVGTGWGSTTSSLPPTPPPPPPGAAGLGLQPEAAVVDVAGDLSLGPDRHGIGAAVQTASHRPIHLQR